MNKQFIKIVFLRLANSLNRGRKKLIKKHFRLLFGQKTRHTTWIFGGSEGRKERTLDMATLVQVSIKAFERGKFSGNGSRLNSPLNQGTHKQPDINSRDLLRIKSIQIGQPKMLRKKGKKLDQITPVGNNSIGRKIFQAAKLFKKVTERK